VRWWDVAGRKEVRKAAVAPRSRATTAPYLAPDGTSLAYGTFEGAIQLWDLVKARPLHTAERHGLRVHAVAFSPAGTRLATADIDTVRLWDSAGKLLNVLHTPEMGQVGVHPVRLVFSPDGRYLAAGTDHGKAILWDAATGKHLRTQDGPFFTFSPDGKWLASFASRKEAVVVLSDVTTGKEVRRFGEGPGFPVGLGFSPDGQTLVAGLLGQQDTQVVIWETATGKERQRIEKAPVPSLSLLVSPDGRNVVSPDLHRTLHVWDLGSGKTWRKIEGAGGAFSPDGKLLAREIAPGGVVQVVELATGEERCRFGRHERDLFGLAFSPDGRSLATGSADTTVLLWDLTGRRKDGALVAAQPSPERLRELWEGLAEPNGAKAHRCIWELVAGGRPALAFLRERLKPLRVSDPEIVRLVANLDSDDYRTRERAEDTLGRLDRAAEEALRAGLEKRPSLEARRRIESLLENLESRRPAAGWLQTWRALEVLELAGGPEARAALAALAEGHPRSWLTLEAKAALARLANGRRASP
jgi:WD40 repeat protein